MARSDPRIKGVALSEVLQGQVQKALSTLIDVARGRTRRSAVGRAATAHLQSTVVMHYYGKLLERLSFL